MLEARHQHTATRELVLAQDLVEPLEDCRDDRRLACARWPLDDGDVWRVEREVDRLLLRGGQAAVRRPELLLDAGAQRRDLLARNRSLSGRCPDGSERDARRLRVGADDEPELRVGRAAGLDGLLRLDAALDLHPVLVVVEIEAGARRRTARAERLEPEHPLLVIDLLDLETASDAVLAQRSHIRLIILPVELLVPHVGRLLYRSKQLVAHL